MTEQIAPDVSATGPQEGDALCSMEGVFKLVCKGFYDAPIEDSEDRREQLLDRRFRLPLNRVRIGPSQRHGMGAFATQRTPADDILIMYPGDALRLCPSIADGGMGQERSEVSFGDHVPEELRTDDQVMTKYRPFNYDVDGMYALVGLPDLAADLAYAGHMVNDASTCSAAPEDRERYRKQSMTDCNATFEGLLDAAVAVVASKPKAEGEKVIVAYGPEYWTSLDKLKGVQIALAAKARARAEKKAKARQAKPRAEGQGAEKRSADGQAPH